MWQDIAKYGGTNLLITKNLENGISDYVYSEDKDGFQVVCFGDRVGDIQKMFQPHFGNPYKAETNLDVISSFIYGNDQLVMSCGLESGMIDGHYKNLTHLTVIKLSAINK